MYLIKRNLGLMLGYCKGRRIYRLICLETMKIIKSPNVTFFENMEALKKHLSERNEDPNQVGDAFSKLNLEEDEEQGKEEDFKDDENQEEDLEVGKKQVEAPLAPNRG